MERLKLIVDSKEIAKRYVGDRLVWENLKFLDEIQRCFAYFGDDRIFIYADSYDYIEVEKVKKIEFDGVEMTGFSSFLNQNYQYVIIFSNSSVLENFKEKAGLKDVTNKPGVTLKLYGR